MKRIATVSMAALISVAGVLAQTNVVDSRRENQQDRIAQGVGSGQLTAGETSRLEKREAAINQEVRTDRTLNGGRLTAGERQLVNGQQNRVSQRIYADKHNAVKPSYGNNLVGARRLNQQNRIANGIQSGRLTAAQASRLEKGESAVNREVHAERAANGGRLTPGERVQVNQQQNNLSGRIYRDKHF